MKTTFRIVKYEDKYEKNKFYIIQEAFITLFGLSFGWSTICIDKYNRLYSYDVPKNRKCEDWEVWRFKTKKCAMDYLKWVTTTKPTLTEVERVKLNID